MATILSRHKYANNVCSMVMLGRVVRDRQYIHDISSLLGICIDETSKPLISMFFYCHGYSTNDQ